MMNQSLELFRRFYRPAIFTVLLASLAPLDSARAQDTIDFNTQVKPILETMCVRCHGAEHPKGKLNLTTKEGMLKGGSSGDVVVPGDPAKSPLYTSTQLPMSDENKMPPKDEHLTPEQSDILKKWITQGAKWPDGVKLVARKKETASVAGDDEVILITEIHKKILSSGNPDSASGMTAYTDTIPGTKISFNMIPIPGGSFIMGSPKSEPKRGKDEGPQHKVTISPFWMEKCEVTWNEFELFMYPEQLQSATTNRDLSDAVTHPTKPYVEMSFGMGKDGFPAISMTQHAANSYCKWLSAKTGHFYRLPTEAEWEYACRAGTTTAYSFGDDVSKLGDYAWYAANSDGKYQKVGLKKPNPWGLYDMHGNVWEWTLDQYNPAGYAKTGPDNLTDPWVKATTPYPQTVRGGSWQDDPDKLRSAARLGSDPAWKIQDPQLPKSIWYHTDAQFLGFRVIRPLKVPSPEELKGYWDSGVEKD